MDITVRLDGIGSGDTSRLAHRLAARSRAARPHSFQPPDPSSSPPPGGEGSGVGGSLTGELHDAAASSPPFPNAEA